MSHPMSAVAPQTIVVWPDCQAGTRPGPRRGSRAHPPLFRAAPRNAFVPTGTATYPPSEPLDSVFSLPHSGLDFNGLPNFRRKDPGPGGRIRAGKTRADTPASAGRSETTGPLIFHRCPCLARYGNNPPPVEMYLYEERREARPHGSHPALYR